MNETRNEQNVAIDTPFIRLDALLKLAGAAQSGGQAKVIVQAGRVLVNDSVCTMRGKKLVSGDKVQVAGETLCYRVTAHDR